MGQRISIERAHGFRPANATAATRRRYIFLQPGGTVLFAVGIRLTFAVAVAFGHDIRGRQVVRAWEYLAGSAGAASAAKATATAAAEGCVRRSAR